MPSSSGSSPAGLNKPVVLYDRQHDNYYIVVGKCACVRALNHPALGNDNVVTTVVLNFDPDTGIFETRNTIYKPGD